MVCRCSLNFEGWDGFENKKVHQINVVMPFSNKVMTFICFQVLVISMTGMIVFFLKVFPPRINDQQLFSSSPLTPCGHCSLVCPCLSGSAGWANNKSGLRERSCDGSFDLMVFRLSEVLLAELWSLFPFGAVFSTLDSSHCFQTEPAETKTLYHHQKHK